MIVHLEALLKNSKYSYRKASKKLFIWLIIDYKYINSLNLKSHVHPQAIDSTTLLRSL
jgi:hypothetical protein